MSVTDPHSAAIVEFGGHPNNFPNIVEAASNSRAQIDRARRALAGTEVSDKGIAAVAIGSIGRLEALEASDVDFALLYDPEDAAKGTADSARSSMISLLAGAGFENVSEKTFSDPRASLRSWKTLAGIRTPTLALPTVLFF